MIDGAADGSVAAPQDGSAASSLVFRSVFNLRQLFALYDIGAALLPKRERARWCDSFALASSNRGTWTAERDGRTVGLAAFWRTKNPHVNLAREIPVPDPDGNYVYICWMWRFEDIPLARLLQAHVQESVPEAEFIAWHDQRAKTKKRRRARLWVMSIGDANVMRLLASRNGSH